MPSPTCACSSYSVCCWPGTTPPTTSSCTGCMCSWLSGRAACFRPTNRHSRLSRQYRICSWRELGCINAWNGLLSTPRCLLLFLALTAVDPSGVCICTATARHCWHTFRAVEGSCFFLANSQRAFEALLALLPTCTTTKLQLFSQLADHVALQMQKHTACWSSSPLQVSWLPLGVFPSHSFVSTHLQKRPL